MVAKQRAWKSLLSCIAMVMRTTHGSVPNLAWFKKPSLSSMRMRPSRMSNCSHQSLHFAACSCAVPCRLPFKWPVYPLFSKLSFDMSCVTAIGHGLIYNQVLLCRDFQSDRYQWWRNTSVSSHQLRDRSIGRVQLHDAYRSFWTSLASDYG